VPETLFDRVQAVLRGAGRVSPHHLNNPDFPLRRFVVCDACGTPLTGSAPRGRSKRYSYYHCRRCKGVSVRHEVLEGRFLALLGSLRPKVPYMKLFRAVVMDLWKKRLAQAGSLQTELAARLQQLQQRESILDDTYLFEKRIDAATYERQRDKLREDIAVARIDLEDAKLEEIDVEGVLGFAEHVLTDAARLWTEAPLEQKQRLQRALFPEGLRLKAGRFGTAVTCLAFTTLAKSGGADSDLASPEGPALNYEPVFQGIWMSNRPAA
jgi:site-specific DNA recombinase